ncbi:DUF397 domain-containing protein [Actinoalloteichus hymeniacidonis]|uniref:DUF397 family protein n=1 Tax=Actinoalloteichus hymeniacidonis TaxID=340345 RepID=A0AAC9N111_9PSEU|nr:DUF397 domain-containing protein [Actinoalloteichus hymeniacidonis]AOS65970.1 putative DUF397 family protein [Actinoalloteichus hymeniacidonis]MBB5905930.1 hypothetical protein [Actinoalloteichus hymeniacidonis]
MAASFTNWRKSQRSLSQGHCVEVGRLPELVGIRDSKNPDGGTLAVTRSTFGTLLASIKADRLR